LAEIGGMNIKELAFQIIHQEEINLIGSFPLLEKLELVNWKNKSAHGITSDTVRVLTIARGHLVDFAGLECPKLDALCCARINSLVSVGDVHVCTLLIERCRSIDYRTIANVVSLRHLGLVDQGKVSDLEVVGDCPELRQIVVRSTPLSANEANRFKPSKTLRIAHFERASDEILIGLSLRYSEVAFSNIQGCWKAGKAAPKQDSHWALFI
jgi:hypothetical protein